MSPDANFPTHTRTGLDARPAADMKINLPAVCVVVSLLVHSYHAQKLNVNWGPQSMMYLKGKHGRRFVPDDLNSALSLQGLQSWSAVLKGLQRLQSRDLRKSGPILSLKKVLLQYLLER